MTVRMARMRFAPISGDGGKDYRRDNLKALAGQGLSVTPNFLSQIKGTNRIAQFFRIMDLKGVLGGRTGTVETLNRLFRRWYVLQTHSNPDPFGAQRPGEDWFCLSVMAKGPAKKLVKTIDLGAWYYRRIWR
ncbi:hypothetical protein HZC35_06785 [Candidatus Saganbacteria bacterium]|nr:hypothetical protein [Candidatus Saganbacteria bacterium]